jgi:hypothetical protein
LSEFRHRKFEGTLNEMASNAVSCVMANMRKLSLIRGVIREDFAEYPEVVLREAIVNALARISLNRMRISMPSFFDSTYLNPYRNPHISFHQLQ